LREAKDTSGHIVSKVADIDPVAAPDESSNWVSFGESFEVTNGAFVTADQSWTAPSNGAYRFGVYARNLALGPEGNSHTKKLSISVGVLWSEERGRVWVDTDGDRNFKNETSLADYSKSHEIGFFGAENAEDDNRIPFGVKIDRQRKAVYVAVEKDGHGAFVAGPLAANKLTGGLFDGAAPNAQLIDVIFGTAKLPSVLKAFARADVDVVNRSGGIARYNDDGREGFERHVLERAVTVYDKPLVSFSAGKNLFLVNDYVSGEMLRRNRQVSPPYVEAMNSFVWFNPDGLVNTILGPSGSLVTMSRYMPLELQWDDGRRHTYDDTDFDPPAPAGYGIGSNNSPTVPIVSGVLADLISEARREHVRYSTPRLYQALTISARSVPGFPVSEQGYGVVNAVAAWDQLAKMSGADDPANSSLTSFTVARKEAGELKEVNGFSEESSASGGTIDGELWIARQGGYAGARDYKLALRGEDDTYTLLNEKATFKRDVPVRISFAAKVTPKWHVAFLQLIDAKTSAVMQEVPLSVQGPDIPEMACPYVEKYQAITPPRHENVEYVHLGQDVQAARFAMQIPYQGPEGISGRHLPPGFRNAHDAKQPDGEPVNAAHHVGPIESFETLFPNTKPGVQEVYWENRGAHAEYETPYDEPPAADVPITGTFMVTKYAVHLSKDDGDVLHVTNQLAEVEGRLVLYDSLLTSSDVSGEGTHASAELQRTLPAHQAQWRVAVSANGLASGLADIFLLSCTDQKDPCFIAAQQTVGQTADRKPAVLSVDDPKEVNWRIVIRAREKVDRPVSYTVREASLALSATPIQAADKKYASGAVWSVPLPAKQSDAQYVAFRVAGTPGNDREKNGVRIALMPVSTDAP
jgi:hypothetical protein